MAAVEVTISGVMYDKLSRTMRPVVLIGEANLTGLGVGGGPSPGGPPLGIWGPTDPRPGTGLPGDQPYPGQGLPGNQPYPDQGLPGNQPYPSHPIFYPPYPTTGPGFPTNPIVIPRPPVEPPTGGSDEDGFVKPPPADGTGWAYHEDYGWMYATGGGKPQPGP